LCQLAITDRDQRNPDNGDVKGRGNDKGQEDRSGQVALRVADLFCDIGQSLKANECNTASSVALTSPVNATVPF